MPCSLLTLISWFKPYVFFATGSAALHVYSLHTCTLSVVCAAQHVQQRICTISLCLLRFRQAALQTY